MISTNCSKFENRAFEMTWRKTSRVSNAVALDPTICLKFKPFKQRKFVHEIYRPPPQFGCEDFHRTMTRSAGSFRYHALFRWEKCVNLNGYGTVVVVVQQMTRINHIWKLDS